MLGGAERGRGAGSVPRTDCEGGAFVTERESLGWRCGSRNGGRVATRQFGFDECEEGLADSLRVAVASWRMAGPFGGGEGGEDGGEWCGWLRLRGRW